MTLGSYWLSFLYLLPLPTPFLPFSVKKILNSQLVSTLLPLFSLSYTSGLCIFVGGVNNPVLVTHDGSFSSNDLPTWTESSLLPGKNRSDSTSDLGTDMWRRWESVGGGTPDPSVRIPLRQRCWAQAPIHSRGSPIPQLAQNWGVSKRLPHSFDIYFMLTSATWCLIHSCVF